MHETGRAIGGRYRADRELWRGPYAQTLLVTDLRNGRPCVLRQLFTAQAPAAAAQRFEAQATILAKFDHAGLPRFFDAFVEGEGETRTRVIVTSYHPGESLERLLDKGRPLREAQAQALMRRIVPVLAYLHAFEPPVVHRSIKATGIVVGPDGRPCLTDIDFAIPGIEAPAAAPAAFGPEEPALAAPEVLMDGAAPASDIYALGLAILRGMTAEDPAKLLREGVKSRLRSTLGVSEAFAAVLAKMLDPSLERRYADAQALEADLARLAGERGPVGLTAHTAAAAQPPVREAEEPGAGRSVSPLVFAVLVFSLVALAALVAMLRRTPAPEVSLLLPLQTTASTASLDPPAPAVPVSPVAPVGSAAPATLATSPGSPAGPAAPPVNAIAPGATPPAPSEPLPSRFQPFGTAATIPATTTRVTAPVVSVPAVAASSPVNAAPSFEGRLFFDGKPFAGADAPAPIFWFRDDATETDAKPEVQYSAGAFTVHGLPPGRYRMSVRIDQNPANPSLFPGDFYASAAFSLENGKPLVLEIPLRRVVRLLQPVDNDVAVPGWGVACGAGVVIPSRSVFAWESLDPEASYDTSIDRYVCGRGNAPVGTVAGRSTSDTWMKVELPASREGEYYSFKLAARKGGRPIGVLTTHGKTGVAWEFRFTVAGR